MSADASPARPPTFAEAVGLWLKVGLISFGGPAGQIAILHEELVDRRKWIDERAFLTALNFCMLLPGPEGYMLVSPVASDEDRLASEAANQDPCGLGFGKSSHRLLLEAERHSSHAGSCSY